MARMNADERRVVESIPHVPYCGLCGVVNKTVRMRYFRDGGCGVMCARCAREWTLYPLLEPLRWLRKRRGGA